MPITVTANVWTAAELIEKHQAGQVSFGALIQSYDYLGKLNGGVSYLDTPDANSIQQERDAIYAYATQVIESAETILDQCERQGWSHMIKTRGKAAK